MFCRKNEGGYFAQEVSSQQSIQDLLTKAVKQATRPVNTAVIIENKTDEDEVTIPVNKKLNQNASASDNDLNTEKQLPMILSENHSADEQFSASKRKQFYNFFLVTILGLNIRSLEFHHDELKVLLHSFDAGYHSRIL